MTITMKTPDSLDDAITDQVSEEFSGQEDNDGEETMRENQESMQELKRRSTACLITVMKINEQNTDDWLCSMKGTALLLGALRSYEENKICEALVKQGLPPDGAGILGIRIK